MNPADYDPHWWWLTAALLLGITELLAPGVFLIFLSIAAALTGLAALVGVPLPFQLALFPLFALGAVYAGGRWYKRGAVESSDPLLNDRLARHMGKTVVVMTAIENGRGRVRLGDGEWPVRGPDAAAGARVVVTGADGTCLKVEPAPPSLPSH